MRVVIAAAVASLALAACSKDKAAAPAQEAAPKADEAGKVYGLPVAVELPKGAVANDPTGAPGFHSEDGAIFALVKKSDETAPKDLAAAKSAVEEFAFKRWVRSEKTQDGWVLAWVGVGIDMEGNEYDTNAYEVVKSIGGTTYSCGGSVKQAANVDANLKLCNSLRAAN